MQTDFQCVCNCLFPNENLSQQGIDTICGKLIGLGVIVDSNIVAAQVQRFGNWVGGRVHVTDDTVRFTTNALNKKFQTDGTDLIIPTEMISQPKFGKMFGIFKTVDCTVLGQALRFRCIGKSSGNLREALQVVTSQ